MTAYHLDVLATRTDLRLLLQYLLGGLIRKAAMPLSAVSLTDLYGVLISSRILIPDDITQLDPRFLSLHGFRRYVDNGSLPMPIFTSISRHLPQPLAEAEGAVKDKQNSAVDAEWSRRLASEQRRIDEQARWLWL